MSSKFSKKLKMTNVPVAWMLEITGGADAIAIASPAGNTDAANRFKFPTCGDGQSFELAVAEDTGGEYKEWALAGNITFKAPVAPKEYDITQLQREAATSGDADYLQPKDITPAENEQSGKGTFTLEIFGADIDSATAGEFYNKFKEKVNNYFLVVIPLAFTHHSKNVAAKADAYAYFVAKISGTVNLLGDPISLSLVPVKHPKITDDAAWQTAVTGLDFAATPVSEEPGSIELPGNESFLIIPKNLTVGDEVSLKNGDFVIKHETYV
jgi:hypothetical protein